MPRRIVTGLAGLEAAVYITASAVRHAGWWLEWRIRPAPGAGCRDLTDCSLAPEQPCASSS
jgi:hypothetical protein